MWVSFTGQRVFSEVWGLWPLVGSRAVLLACYLRAGSETFIRNICGLLTSVTGRVGEKRREDSVRFPDRVLKMQSFPLRDSQGGRGRVFQGHLVLVWGPHVLDFPRRLPLSALQAASWTLRWLSLHLGQAAAGALWGVAECAGGLP